MKNLRLSNDDSYFEAEASIEADPSLQSHGDARLVLRVRSKSYAGESTAWVGRDELAKFFNDVEALSRSSGGEATLSSMSPNELMLKIVAVNAQGHFALEGSIGRHIYSENSRFWHSVSFGFEVGRTQLESILALTWVTPNVA